MRRHRFEVALAAIASVGFAGLLTACGVSKVVDPVAQAATQSAKSGGANVAMTISVAEDGSAATVISATGVVGDGSADLTLDHAHEVADSLERGIRAAAPEVDIVHSHIEPIAPPVPGHDVAFAAPEVARIVEEVTGRPPRELRFIESGDGDVVAWLTLGLDGEMMLRQAHREASEIEERIRRERPDIADVVVHTEPDRMEDT